VVGLGASLLIGGCRCTIPWDRGPVAGAGYTTLLLLVVVSEPAHLVLHQRTQHSFVFYPTTACHFVTHTGLLYYSLIGFNPCHPEGQKDEFLHDGPHDNDSGNEREFV